MTEHTPETIRAHIDGYTPRLRTGVLHDWAKDAREMLKDYAERLGTDDAEDAHDNAVADSRAHEIAVHVELISQIELERLRGFAETIASVLKGKPLGDEACRALGREPERKAG